MATATRSITRPKTRPESRPKTRQKKRIRVPIEAQVKKDDGVGMRATIFIVAFLILGGLFYAYQTRPEMFAQIPKIGFSEPSTTGSAPAPL